MHPGMTWPQLSKKADLQWAWIQVAARSAPRGPLKRRPGCCSSMATWRMFFTQLSTSSMPGSSPMPMLCCTVLCCATATRSCSAHRTAMVKLYDAHKCCVGLNHAVPYYAVLSNLHKILHHMTLQWLPTAVQMRTKHPDVPLLHAL